MAGLPAALPQAAHEGAEGEGGGIEGRERIAARVVGVERRRAVHEGAQRAAHGIEHELAQRLGVGDGHDCEAVASAPEGSWGAVSESGRFRQGGRHRVR